MLILLAKGQQRGKQPGHCWHTKTVAWQTMEAIWFVCKDLANIYLGLEFENFRQEVRSFTGKGETLVPKIPLPYTLWNLRRKLQSYFKPAPAACSHTSPTHHLLATVHLFYGRLGKLAIVAYMKMKWGLNCLVKYKTQYFCKFLVCWVPEEHTHVGGSKGGFSHTPYSSTWPHGSALSP